MHRGRSDRAANANANSDAPRQFASEFSAPNLKQKAANLALRRNSLANANGFANEMAKISFSLRKFLANGRLRQNSLAIANAMAWCTQQGTSNAIVGQNVTNRSKAHEMFQSNESCWNLKLVFHRRANIETRKLWKSQSVVVSSNGDPKRLPEGLWEVMWRSLGGFICKSCRGIQEFCSYCTEVVQDCSIGLRYPQHMPPTQDRGSCQDEAAQGRSINYAANIFGARNSVRSRTCPIELVLVGPLAKTSPTNWSVI